MRCALVLLLLLAAALPAVADARLEKLVGDLASPEQDVRYAAYNALRREKSPHVADLLVKALPDCPEMGQYYGVLILQQLERKQAVAALRRLVGARSTHLRVLAAAYLLRQNERGVADVIVKALGDERATPEQLATRILRVYSIRDPDVQAAVRALLSTAQPYRVLENALYGVYLTRDRQALAAVRALDAHEDQAVRALAAGCALVLGDAQGGARLVEAVRAGGLTSGVVYKLKNFLSAAGSVPVEVLEALHARLETEQDVNVLRSLVEMLGERRYAKAAPAIRKLVDHRDDNLAKAAFEALTRLPGAVTPQAMRDLLAKGSDARRLAAADALRRADDFSGLPVVLEILRKGERDTDRWEAAALLAGFRFARVVDALLDALADPHLTVRANAYNSLGTVLRSLFPYRRLDLASTGYATTAAPALRASALAKLRAWWKAHRDRDW